MIFKMYPNKETPIVDYYIELNKGIIKTLEYTIKELPFYKHKKKKFLKECIRELEEYLSVLKPIREEEENENIY